jgi:hypothetical protein
VLLAADLALAVTGEPAADPAVEVYGAVLGSERDATQLLEDGFPGLGGDSDIVVGVLLFIICFTLGGNTTLIYLANLQSVPQDLIEAARPLQQRLHRHPAPALERVPAAGAIERGLPDGAI